MSLRFRRRVTLAPGLRLNFSKSGVSLSAGPRGASVTVGKQGVYRNLGIPGTGIYHRTRISDLGGGGGQGRGRGSPSVAGSDLRLGVSETGWVTLEDASGRELPDAEARRVREALREPIHHWLREEVERINAGIGRILEIHRETPAPEPLPPYRPAPFPEARPQAPDLRRPHLLARLIPPWRRAIERRGAEAERRYRAELEAWEARRAAHEAEEQARDERIEAARAGEAEAMLVWAEEALGAIDWPRETEARFEVSEDGATFFLEVDLPPEEAMPAERAEMSKRAFKINLREPSERRLREVYARHVHGIGFRLVGEVFRDLPAVRTVVISGVRPVVDPATGVETEECLYSARIARERWEEIDFERLDALDPVAAFERFELRREMTKTGVFRGVQPW